MDKYVINLEIRLYGVLHLMVSYTNKEINDLKCKSTINSVYYVCRTCGGCVTQSVVVCVCLVNRCLQTLLASYYFISHMVLC